MHNEPVLAGGGGRRRRRGRIYNADQDFDDGMISTTERMSKEEFLPRAAKAIFGSEFRIHSHEKRYPQIRSAFRRGFCFIEKGRLV